MIQSKMPKSQTLETLTSKVIVFHTGYELHQYNSIVLVTGNIAITFLTKASQSVQISVYLHLTRPLHYMYPSQKNP